MQLARPYRTPLILVLGLVLTSTGLATDRFREHWYKATLNHVDTHLWVLILTRGERRYVRQLDLRLLGLAEPSADPVHHASEVYYPADSLAGINLYLDRRDRRIFFIDRSRPEIATPPSPDLLLTVTVDGRRLEKPQYLRYANGELLLPAAALEAMRIKPAEARQPPVPAHRLAGEYFSLDYRTLTLNAVIPPRFLKKSLLKIPRHPASLATQVTGSEMRQPVAQLSGQHQWSAIVGYDIAGGYSSGAGNWRSGIYRAAIGSRAATCRTAYLDSPYDEALRRLDSRCSFDWPEQMVSLSIGDAIGGGNAVAQPVRYGGLRIGTDFGLQPNFITLPFSHISGTARVPSTLEVWVDQMLALRTEVPAGPFEVQGIPLHTGSGELQAAVVSPTGARHVIASPFYVDSSLLAAGLSDWSIGLGKLRTDFATAADQYGDPFAAGGVRYGLTNGLTGSAALQATQDFHLLTAGATLRLGYFAAVDLAAGHSVNRSGGSGSAIRARLSHQGPHLSFSYQWQRNSSGYQELAWPLPGQAPETTQQLSFGMPVGGAASFNVAGYRQRYFDGTSLQFLSASLNVRLGDWGSLLLSGFHLAEDHAPWAYAAQLTVPFGARSNFSAWSRTEGSVRSQRIGLQMNPPAGPGMGYRLDIGKTGSTRSALVDLQLQGESAELNLGGRHFAGETAASARLAGSILLSGGGLSLSRRQPGSYAVVDVGVPGVPVYRDGQLAAYSGSDGDAVVAGLRPYDDNVIAIQPGDVPIDVQPRALEAVLTPGRREIMSASFGFQPVRYLTGRLRVAEQQFVPRGATLEVAGAAAKTVVGSNGRFFITAPGGGSLTIEAHWAGLVCRAATAVEDGGGATPVVELGVLNCKMENR